MRPLTGQTRLAGVIGDPVRHSLSPVIHNAAFRAVELDWVFLALPVAAGQSGGAIAAMTVLGIEGLSVTMPHKAGVAAAVDRCSPTATTLGAVNCVVRDGDELVGHNTDGDGFVDALRVDAGVDLQGRRVVVVGAGGAARAVVLAVAAAGAADVVVVNRSPGPAAVAVALAGERGRVGAVADVAAADVVVNATPVGMGSAPVGSDPVGRLPVPADALVEGQVVVDLVYQPVRTPLLEAAELAGARPVDGIGMLVHQAAHAFRLWTGVEPPVAVMAAAARRHLALPSTDR